LRILLRRDDAVTSRAAAQVEDHLAPGEIALAREPAPGAHPDTEGCGVQLARVFYSVTLVHPEDPRRLFAARIFSEPVSGGVVAAARRCEPWSGEAFRAFDQETLEVRGVRVVIAAFTTRPSAVHAARIRSAFSGVISAARATVSTVHAPAEIFEKISISIAASSVADWR